MSGPVVLADLLPVFFSTGKPLYVADLPLQRHLAVSLQIRLNDNQLPSGIFVLAAFQDRLARQSPLKGDADPAASAFDPG